MTVYRLVRSKYANLSGTGASKAGGRCNHPGTRAVYTSENVSLTVLEVLVHVDNEEIPEDYVTMAIAVPSSAPVNYQPVDLAIAAADLGQYPVICVPSLIVPQERNYVLYPDVAGFEATILSIEAFNFDGRLFVRSPSYLRARIPRTGATRI